MAICAGDPPNLKIIKYFHLTYYFAMHMSEIGDMNCITPCLVYSWTHS